MKNEKIVSSWNKIEPSEQSKKRMLDSILEQNENTQARKEREYTMSKLNNSKKIFIPIAACLVAIIAIGGIFGGNSGKDYTVTLDNGESLVYNKASMEQSGQMVDLAATVRELTSAELELLLPNIACDKSATACFDEKTGELFRFEGKLNNAKIIFSKGNNPLTDCILMCEESNISTIKGVPVECGLFITDPNSKGEQTAIFQATFKLGDTNVSVELAGAKNEADTVSKNHAQLVELLIDNGELDFSLVKA